MTTTYGIRRPNNLGLVQILFNITVDGLNSFYFLRRMSKVGSTTVLKGLYAKGVSPPREERRRGGKIGVID